MRGARSGAMSPIALLALASLGCGDAADPSTDPNPVVVRDSAGITIVTNAGLGFADSTALRIDSANIVSIGELKGDDPYLFGRVVGAVRQDNGHILVADAHTENIRVFGDDGLFIRRIGRPGEGPGEFANLRGLERVFGDSLLATDWEGGRLNILSPEGVWIRSRINRDLPVTRGIQTRIESLFGDGTALARESIRGCEFPQLEGVMCADTSRYHRVDDAGQELAEFGSLPNRRAVMIREGLPTRVGVGALAWGQPFHFAGDEHFYYADGERFEARVFTLDGALERIVRVDLPQIEAEPTDFNQLPASGPLEGFAAAARRAHLASEFPPHLPQVEGLWVDRVGRIWLREWVVRAQQTVPTRWFIFSPEGELLYSLRQPLYRIYEIGEDYILGSSFDAMGVERVQLLPFLVTGVEDPAVPR